MTIPLVQVKNITLDLLLYALYVRVHILIFVCLYLLLRIISLFENAEDVGSN